MPAKTAILILAGGRSRRMGRDKALLPYPPGEVSSTTPPQTFVEHLLTILSPVASQIALVARDAQQATQLRNVLGPIWQDLLIVEDQISDGGPLVGIVSGLRVVQAERVLVCAVDMPFILPELVEWLLEQASNDALLVPMVADVPQVLLAVYPRALLSTLEQRLQSGRRDPRSLLSVVPVRYISESQLREIDPQLRSFANFNTPEELQELNRGRD